MMQPEVKMFHRPPNFEDIVKVFPGARGKGVIFAHYPHIYAPSGMNIPQSLIDHEAVHIERQMHLGVAVWWDQYLTNKSFRYHEELLAHRAEYQSLIKDVCSTAMRERHLKNVAMKLAAPLYGCMNTPKRCMDDILEGVR